MGDPAVDLVFKALSDPTRRLMLDRLFQRDGQSIRELGSDLGMGRFGVAKHLRILERSSLVSARRVGRERLHYLNPVPIQQMQERWVGKYAEPWVRAMTGLKAEVEARSRPRHVYHVFIRARPQAVWRAITDGEFTQRYFYGTAVASEWRVGSPFSYRAADGEEAITGVVLEVDAPRRLMQTFRFTNRDDPPSRVTWEIEPMGDACRLTLIHEFDSMDGSYSSVSDAMGWQLILSGMKTLLETGAPLVVAR